MELDVKPGLYANINKRKEAGTSRPKSESTIDPKTYSMMKRKVGGFKEKKSSLIDRFASAAAWSAHHGEQECPSSKELKSTPFFKS